MGLPTNPSMWRTSSGWNDRTGHIWGVVVLSLALASAASSLRIQDYSEMEDMYERPQRFNFGLGKRSGAGEVGDQALVDLGWWGLSGPHGLFKKSGQPRVESIKRGAYSFGLGKRSQPVKTLYRRPATGATQFSFGLG